jgi:PAP2 superfamily
MTTTRPVACERRIQPVAVGRLSASKARGTGVCARFAVVELAIWGAVYGAYLALRGLTIGSPAEALAHADKVVGAERALDLFHEASLQRALGPLVEIFSTYYLLGFGPVLGLVIVWLALRRPELYRELRTVLLVSLAIASIGYVLFPTAPPRLVPGLGIADTVGLSGHDHGSFAGIRFDPYAAMPSMHVGWALIVGVYGRRAARTLTVRRLFVLHPAVMAVAVSATGNHYFLDSAAGIAVAGLALTLVRLRPRLRLERLTSRRFLPHLAYLTTPCTRAAWPDKPARSALQLERSAV